MQTNFPIDDYTPFGYLDNPYHSWKLNRSGVIRVNPPCGMGWLFPNANQPIYHAAVNVGFKLVNECIVLHNEWQPHNIMLNSHYHSKEIFNFNWTFKNLYFDVDFFLLEEDVINVIVKIKNNQSTISSLDLLLQNSLTLNYGKTGLWDFGLSAKFEQGLIIKNYAEGPCFIVKANQACFPIYFSDSSSLDEFISQELTPFFSTQKNSIFAIMSIPIELDPFETTEMNCYFARGISEAQVLINLDKVIGRENHILSEKFQKDDEFWSQCPQLVGDWPQHWRRGWVYDWETMRMNVRNHMGIYHTPWDAMQIQKPRVVLAETALDMMMMSYADANLSKEVIRGMFQDALGPQIPCSREDGSLNMIAENGSECGTSPAWCFPFYCFQSILLRHFDIDWLTTLYPYLTSYLQWWIKNRTDGDGWGVYKCSWESGQDASLKFRIQQPTGGEIISHIRPVDLQAGLALSMKIMAFFADVLNEDSEQWRHLQNEFYQKIKSMWRGTWFCDYDKTTDCWIDEKQYLDITNLAPFLTNAVKKEHINVIKAKFEYFKNNPKLWLEWASFFFMYLEACWQINLKELATEVLYNTTDRVYRNWDRRIWNKDESMPGISVECWGTELPYGSEGYGWAATLPLHIIRTIIGYREYTENFTNQFTLTPNLSEQLIKKGNQLAIKNLKFQDKIFSVYYEINNNKKIKTNLEVKANVPFTIKVLKYDIVTEIAVSKLANKIQTIQFEAKNRNSYYIVISR